jgi:hypothetical protein
MEGWGRNQKQSVGDVQFKEIKCSCQKKLYFTVRPLFFNRGYLTGTYLDVAPAEEPQEKPRRRVDLYSYFVLIK